MATQTAHYELEKPALTDVADIAALNNNFDDIDTVMFANQERGKAAVENAADAYDATQTYAVDDLVIYENKLYKCTTAVETAEPWDSTKWTRTTLAESGGGGGKFQCDLLYENTDFSVGSGTTDVDQTYTLGASIDDYDAVIVSGWMYNNRSNGRDQLSTIVILASEFYTRATSGSTDLERIRGTFTLNGSIGNGRRQLLFGFADDTTLLTRAKRSFTDEQPALKSVYGIKF